MVFRLVKSPLKHVRCLHKNNVHRWVLDPARVFCVCSQVPQRVKHLCSSGGSTCPVWTRLGFAPALSCDVRMGQDES